MKLPKIITADTFDAVNLIDKLESFQNFGEAAEWLEKTGWRYMSGRWVNLNLISDPDLPTFSTGEALKITLWCQENALGRTQYTNFNRFGAEKWYMIPLTLPWRRAFQEVAA